MAWFNAILIGVACLTGGTFLAKWAADQEGGSVLHDLFYTAVGVSAFMLAVVGTLMFPVMILIMENTQ